MTDGSTLDIILENTDLDEQLKRIGDKVRNHERITPEEGVLLYEQADLAFLGSLANHVRERLHGDKTFFNRNFHVEPTNICVYSCKFCSYYRKEGQEGVWEFTIEDVTRQAESFKDKGVTEVHIVGGVHPKRDLHYYGQMIQAIKQVLPDIHVKAFTAVELYFMIRRSRVSIEEGLAALKAYGLDSIPGGGAEIFDPVVRKQICHEKSDARQWLHIHETAHQLGIPSNATMLYGHVETYAHRIDHMDTLRKLQDRTGMFNTFIPLKFRKANNEMEHVGEVNTLEDLRNYAVARVFLDNFPHLKAYWPMIGKQTTQVSLSFGVDDIDGTIDDTTKIYSMAGVEDQQPTLNTEQLVKLIKDVGRQPIERDTLYNTLRAY